MMSLPYKATSNRKSVMCTDILPPFSLLLKLNHLAHLQYNYQNKATLYSIDTKAILDDSCQLYGYFSSVSGLKNISSNGDGEKNITPLTVCMNL